MLKIELIYDCDCPNVVAARDELRIALAEAGLAPDWTEWDRAADESPAYARTFGSPTVLVNGEDVTGAGAESEANCCRVYQGTDGKFRGTPSADDIVLAVRAAVA
jgi:hypothetical protein